MRPIPKPPKRWHSSTVPMMFCPIPRSAASMTNGSNLSSPSRSESGSDTWASSRSDWIGAPGSSEGAGGSRWLYAFGRFRHYWVFYVLALVAIFLGSLWYESLYLHRSKALTPLASAVSAARQEPVPPVEPSLFARPPTKPTPGAPGSQATSGPEADSADSLLSTHRVGLQRTDLLQQPLRRASLMPNRMLHMKRRR